MMAHARCNCRSQSKMLNLKGFTRCHPGKIWTLANHWTIHLRAERRRRDLVAYSTSRAAPSRGVSYPWKHFIGGHLGRLDNVKIAMGKVDPTPYFQKHGDNAWAGVRGYLDEITDVAAAPVIEKYTGVLARRMCTPRARRSGLWSRCGSTSASAHGFIPNAEFESPARSGRRRAGGHRMRCPDPCRRPRAPPSCRER